MLENVGKTPRSFAADRPLSQQESHPITILHNHLNSRPTIWDAQLNFFLFLSPPPPGYYFSFFKDMGHKEKLGSILGFSIYLCVHYFYTK